jgi:D-alanyl-D-alanine dipeptidase
MSVLWVPILVLPLATSDDASAKEIEDFVAAAPGVVDVGGVVPNLLVELKYATTDNFLKKNVYGSLSRCFLQTEAARMLADAARWLERRDNNLRLLAYDCLRPRRVQRMMWEEVKGTPQQGYVADPNSKTGSIHNYGCAIDLTLASSDGRALDMGTPFDHFGVEAQPRHEIKMVADGRLSKDALANRLLLREVMVRAGFQPIANEWWHFNCASASQTRKRYKIVD